MSRPWLHPPPSHAMVGGVHPIPVDLRRRLEEARLDNLALMRALDRVFPQGPPVAQPILSAWFELEGDCAEGLWALDQPPGKLDLRAMVRETLASLEKVPAARDRVRSALAPAERRTLAEVEPSIRATLDPAEAYSQLAGRNPNARRPRAPAANATAATATATNAGPRPGRNDPCPCGSGKKYKKCCALRSPESPVDTRPRFRFEPGSYGGPGGYFPSIMCKKDVRERSEMHFVLVNSQAVHDHDQDAVNEAEENLNEVFSGGGADPERIALHLRELGYVRVDDPQVASG